MPRCTAMFPRCYSRANNVRDCSCQPFGSGKTLEDRVEELERTVKTLCDAQGQPS